MLIITGWNYCQTSLCPETDSWDRGGKSSPGCDRYLFLSQDQSVPVSSIVTGNSQQVSRPVWSLSLLMKKQGGPNWTDFLSEYIKYPSLLSLPSLHIDHRQGLDSQTDIQIETIRQARAETESRDIFNLQGCSSRLAPAIWGAESLPLCSFINSIWNG